jgi:hypothetical protein
VGHDEIKQGESRKRVARWERGQGRGREGTGRDATGGGGRGTACGPEFDLLTRAEIGGRWRWMGADGGGECGSQHGIGGD